jgi:HlyD family secretion protein
MTVAPPRSWIALAAIGLLFAGVLAWGIGGRLRVEVTAGGVCAGAPLEAIVYLRARDARQVRAGAPALVLPEVYDAAEYGYIQGTVAAMDAALASRDSMRATLGDDRIAERLAASGPVVALRVRLSPDPNSASGVRWSSSTGPQSVPSGIPCTATITVAERRPVTIVIPALGRIFGE